MKKIALVLSIALTAAGVVAAARAPDPIVVGALYPTAGGQGPGGLAEYHGVQLAAEWVNAHGGVGGRPVELRLEPADSSDQAPGAVERLEAAGVPVILGSYGSTISRPAADAAQRAGIVFWETGAVGQLGMAASRGDRVFRYAPTGRLLGTSAVDFAREVLLPRLGRAPRALRYGVAYVDDDYGRSVGFGERDAVRRAGLRLAGTFPYDLTTVDYRALARRIERSGTQVLFVSAYLADGIAMRRELVRRGVRLMASVGTSSSYCMHEFGVALGRDAVGLFASDKPDGQVLDPSSLRPEAAAAFRWARAEFRARYHHELTAGALTGFSGAYALFGHVLPSARGLTSDAIAAAARAVRVPRGGLPNGSGLAFGAAGRPGGSDNLRATSVIWEWVAPGTRAVVWPPAFATSPVLAIEPRP